MKNRSCELENLNVHLNWQRFVIFAKIIKYYSFESDTHIILLFIGRIDEGKIRSDFKVGRVDQGECMSIAVLGRLLFFVE